MKQLHEMSLTDWIRFYRSSSDSTLGELITLSSDLRDIVEKVYNMTYSGRKLSEDEIEELHSYCKQVLGDD